MGINNAFTYNKQNFLFDTFAFTVQTTAPNETFALPLFSDGTYNFVCHWGDNSEDTITAYNQAEVTHTYASAGTYTIQISGICTKFAFDNGGDKAKVRKILNVTDCGFTKLNFYGCSGLNEVKRPFRKLKSLTSFQDGFRGCTSLTEIPLGLFDKLTAIAANGFYSTFYGCTGLTSIPTDLFRYNVNVSTSGFRSTFYGCTGLTSIPADCFRYNINVSSSGFNATFYGCTGLTSIPADCFRYNINVSTSGFSSTFRGCTGLTSIPTDCFRYNINVSTYGFYQTFYGCTGLAHVLQNDMFAYNVVCTSVEGCFSGCTNLQGAGLDFIAACPASITGGTTTSCFTGCTTLSDYASIPAAWGGGGA